MRRIADCSLQPAGRCDCWFWRWIRAKQLPAYLVHPTQTTCGTTLTASGSTFPVEKALYLSTNKSIQTAMNVSPKFPPQSAHAPAHTTGTWEKTTLFT